MPLVSVMHYRGLNDNEKYYLIFIKPLFNNLVFTVPAPPAAAAKVMHHYASLVQGRNLNDALPALPTHR